jgi:dienelactone hydrolase
MWLKGGSFEVRMGMKPVLKKSLLAVMAVVVVTHVLHRHSLAQSGNATVSTTVSAANANAPSSASTTSIDPSTYDRWATNAAALAKALGDEGVIPRYAMLDADWQDTSRNRPVPIRLYMPHGASATAKVPVVVFSHGLGGSRMGYSYIGKYLAQNGIASLHLQHVGSDRAIWSGNVFAIASRMQEAATDQEAIARAKDFSFALSQLLAHPRWGGLIDKRHIVAAGHSFGANTTLLVAGAKVEHQGQALALRDPRLSAAVMISSPPFYANADAKQALATMPVPSLHITATDDVIRVPGYYSSAEDRIQVYEAYQGAPKGLVVFKDGSHSMFTDRLNTGGVDLNPQVKRATREAVLAFVQSTIQGRTMDYDRFAQQHQPLLARLESSPKSAAVGLTKLASQP